MFKTWHDAFCCFLGCFLFPALAACFILSSGVPALVWGAAVILVCTWESAGLPKGGRRGD